MSLVLIDIGSGNLHSVENALHSIGCSNLVVTADPAVVASAERIVLPGVGAFGACAASLRGIDGLEAALGEAVLRRGAPFLGICVGMQLMAQAGEELGVHRGLGWMPGRVRRLVPGEEEKKALTQPLPRRAGEGQEDRSSGTKVPHMGWNDVVPALPHKLIEPGEAYFLHSFAYDGDGVVATTDHGGTVTAAIGRDNLIGVQFHPEKSQRYGLALLKRFLSWRP